MNRLSIERNSFLTLFVLVSTFIASCSKDETDVSTTPESLSGTAWKCTSGPYWDEDLEYALMIFTSNIEVEGRSKYFDEGESKDWEGTYFMSNNQISISYDYASFVGTVDGDKMSMMVDGSVYLFLKE